MKTVVIIVAGLIVVSCTNRSIINNNTSLDANFSMVPDSGSFHEAVVVYSAESPKGLFTAEYQYISDLYGQRGSDWFLMSQTIVREKDKIVDVVEIKGKKPFEQNVIFFDVTNSFSNNPGNKVTLLVRHSPRLFASSSQ
jgi:hypothetical protein